MTDSCENPPRIPLINFEGDALDMSMLMTAGLVDVALFFSVGTSLIGISLNKFLT